MATTTKHQYLNFADMLADLRSLASAAAGVEGADDVGAFFSIAKAGHRGYGEFSSLSEWLDDVADTLSDFLDENLDEFEGWHA